MKAANWFTARKAAISGTRIRRDGWRDKWLIYSDGLWWILPLLSIYDQSDGIPFVVTPMDFGRDEFQAIDWTSDPIPKGDPGTGITLGNLYLIDEVDGTCWQLFVSAGVLSLRAIEKPL